MLLDTNRCRCLDGWFNCCCCCCCCWQVSVCWRSRVLLPRSTTDAVCPKLLFTALLSQVDRKMRSKRRSFASVGIRNPIVCVLQRKSRNNARVRAFRVERRAECCAGLIWLVAKRSSMGSTEQPLSASTEKHSVKIIR